MRGNVAASTQNQALNAIVFHYKEVLKVDLPWMVGIQRAKKPSRLPVVFTRNEVKRLLAQLDGTLWLMASLIYGSGMWLMECVRLRVMDVDFHYKQIIIRDACCGSRSIMIRICRKVMVEFICLMPWTESIPTLPRNGVGNMYFPHVAVRTIHVQILFAVTTT